MNPALKPFNYSETRTYPAGEIILFPGNSTQLYRLRSGLIRIHRVDDEGNGLTLRYVKPRGYFGEEALFQEPRHYFAEAVTSCELLVINPDNLSPGEALEFSVHMAQVVARLYRSLYRLSGKRLKSRIAAELLELQDSALATLNSEAKPTIHMTHDDLAAAVGSVRETVTKVLGELVKEKAIRAGYGKITLNDLALLQRISDD